MSNKTLGILALIGSPWLFVGSYLEQQVPYLSDSWFTGVWGILFISGWMCAAIGLKRLRATGDTSLSIFLLNALLVSLTIANISNIVQVFVERNKPAYFMLLDVFWPLSNIVMVAVGIMAIIAKRLPGWKRYTPLGTGIWFPLAMLTSFSSIKAVSFFFGAFYSAIAWGVLAITIITTRKEWTK